MLLAVLVGPTGYIFAGTLEGSQEQAAPGPSVPDLQGAQLSPDAPTDTAPAEGRHSPSPSEGMSPVSPDRPKAATTFANNRLSVQVQNRSLAWILEEISNKSGIPLILSEGMKDQTVSIRFKDLPLDQGLQVVLKTLDAFYFYGAQGEAPATLKAVWLYPKGKGSRIVPAPPETHASTAEMQQDLSDPDPAERARAAEALIKRQGRRALDTLVQVLVDPDEKVRYRAVNQAVRSGLALPEYLTQQLALYDSSPVVRFLALEAIANVRGADPAWVRQIAELALNDANEVVQQQARDILAEQDATGQPAEPSESQQQGAQ